MSLTPVAPLYLARSRSSRPLPSRRYRPCRSPRSLHSLKASVAAATYDLLAIILRPIRRTAAALVNQSGRLIETHSLPALARCYPARLLPSVSLFPQLGCTLCG